MMSFKKYTQSFSEIKDQTHIFIDLDETLLHQKIMYDVFDIKDRNFIYYYNELLQSVDENDITILNSDVGLVIVCVRPDAYEFINEVKKISDCSILTAGKTSHQEFICKSIGIDLKVVGRDKEVEITPKYFILVDDLNINTTNTQKKIIKIVKNEEESPESISQNHIVNVKTYLGDDVTPLMDYISEIKSKLLKQVEGNI